MAYKVLANRRFKAGHRRERPDIVIGKAAWRNYPKIVPTEKTRPRKEFRKPMDLCKTLMDDGLFQSQLTRQLG